MALAGGDDVEVGAGRSHSWLRDLVPGNFCAAQELVHRISPKRSKKCCRTSSKR